MENSPRICANPACDKPVPPRTPGAGRPRTYCSPECSRRANWGAWRRRAALGELVELVELSVSTRRIEA
jgi:hypothetical protein